MKWAKHCNTQSRESRICPSLETTKTQLEQGFSDLMRMWVENWSRWSPEAPSNLNYSVILQRAQALSPLHFLSFKYIAYVSISLYASHHLCLLGNWWKNLYFLFPSTLEPSEYFGGRDSCEQILFSSNIFTASVFDTVLCFWMLQLLSQHSWLLIMLPTFPVATVGKWLAYSSTGRAANIISKKTRTGAPLFHHWMTSRNSWNDEAISSRTGEWIE